MKNVTVLGAGSWGSALAMMAGRRNAAVTLWGRDAAQVAEINRTRTNEKYLPGVQLGESVTAATNWKSLPVADLIIFALPSQVMRAMAMEAAHVQISPSTVLLSCTKGIEKSTGCRMSEILQQCFPGNPVAVLSGPNHAEEIGQKLAAAAVVGCEDEAVTQRLQDFFTLPWFRTYRSRDVKGIEWGGATKNVFAIAAGLSEGLGLGDNARAALLTRGLAEMIRLGAAEGGNPATFQGLSGVGDLIATCFSHHSRNNRVGRMLGAGKTLEEIHTSMHMVAEGVPNTESIYLNSRRHGIRTPIIDQIYSILYQGKPPKEALTELLSRGPRAENE